MIPPAGTYLARVRDGIMQLPPPLKKYCESEGWSLFSFTVTDEDRLTMQPVLPRNSDVPFHASLDTEGRLWIPAGLRRTISLGEQSVMLRIENGAINMYLRKVFDTLGFRPR
jgi:DNA-binding transcriptional regulator/RsmH inhibitor MraZ